METAINRSLPLQRALLRHRLSGNDLKGQRHRGYQGEDGIDNCRLPETIGAEESRNHDVVGEVSRGCQPRAGEQDNASRHNTRLQRLRILGQSIHRTLESPVQFQVQFARSALPRAGNIARVAPAAYTMRKVRLRLLIGCNCCSYLLHC